MTSALKPAHHVSQITLRLTTLITSWHEGIMRNASLSVALLFTRQPQEVLSFLEYVINLLFRINVILLVIILATFYDCRYACPEWTKKDGNIWNWYQSLLSLITRSWWHHWKPHFLQIILKQEPTGSMHMTITQAAILRSFSKDLQTAP